MPDSPAPPARSRARVYGLRLGAVLFGLALVLAMGEFSARLLEQSSAEPERDDLPTLAPDAGLQRPNLDGILLGHRFRTNSRALRGPEYTPEPAPGVLRIAITGDSFTMGWGVDEEAAYPALLEQRLRSDPPEGVSSRFEVLNVGLAGMPIEGAMDRLEAAVEHYRPHLLVYGFTTNDIHSDAYVPLAPKLARVVLMLEANRFAESPSALLRTLWPRWVATRERIWPSVAPYDEELRHNYLKNAAAWKTFVRGFDRLADLAHGRNHCALVLLHTDLDDDFETPRMQPVYDLVERAARDRGLEVVPSVPRHRGYRLRQLQLAPSDSHPNERGHELLAEALHAGLLELPAGCFDPAGGQQ